VTPLWQGSGVTIEPFRLDVPESELDDLRRRLDLVRWPAELPGAEWSRGVPLAYLQDLVAYWRDGYDWRAAEAVGRQPVGHEVLAGAAARPQAGRTTPGGTGGT